MLRHLAYYIAVKYSFREVNIYNVDERGISNARRILGPKEQKQVAAAVSSGFGRNVSAVCATGTSGNYFPPMAIYPSRGISSQLQMNGLVGTLYTKVKVSSCFN
jgi:hypothetical protein